MITLITSQSLIKKSSLRELMKICVSTDNIRFSITGPTSSTWLVDPMIYLSSRLHSTCPTRSGRDFPGSVVSRFRFKKKRQQETFRLRSDVTYEAISFSIAKIRWKSRYHSSRRQLNSWRALLQSSRRECRLHTDCIVRIQDGNAIPVEIEKCLHVQD